MEFRRLITLIWHEGEVPLECKDAVIIIAVLRPAGGSAGNLETF